MTSQNPTTDDTVTSQNGHCEHCLTGCPYTVGGDGQCHPIRHLSAYGDVWPDGQCDICALIAQAVVAERERIAAEMREQAKHYRKTETIIAECDPQNPTMRESRQFFQGAAEALEWTLAGLTGDSFGWIDGSGE